MEEEFAREHWMSFLVTSKPVLVNYMTCSSPSDIERIIRRLKEVPFILDVETELIYHIQRSTEEAAAVTSELVLEAVVA
jgi:hypothetical protein